MPAKRPILVWDLFRHTSGLTYSGSAPFPELKEAYEKADVESVDTDLSNEEFTKRLAAIPLAIVASTPLLLAVLGELVVERAGMINLGIEGMMLTAAMTAVVAAQWTQSIAIGFVAGIAGAAAIGAIFGLFGALLVIGRHIGANVATIAIILGINLVMFRESWGRYPRLIREKFCSSGIR